MLGVRLEAERPLWDERLGSANYPHPAVSGGDPGRSCEPAIGCYEGLYASWTGGASGISATGGSTRLPDRDRWPNGLAVRFFLRTRRVTRSSGVEYGRNSTIRLPIIPAPRALSCSTDAEFGSTVPSVANSSPGLSPLYRLSSRKQVQRQPARLAVSYLSTDQQERCLESQ